MRHYSVLPALPLLTLLTVPAGAQDIIGSRDSFASRADSVFRAFDRTDSPGCALGVYRDGEIVYARGYGMANLEAGIAIGPRTVFDVGSISKQFTATAILLLAREGKLALDDDIRRHVPEMPPYASGVTVRRILNHTSGIRDYLTLWGLAGKSFEGNGDTVDFQRLITRSAETNFPIGSRYLYSNSGYALAGQIVYRLSGQTLPAFLRSSVFDPLGMRDTRSLDDHATIIPNRAIGYAPRRNGFRLQSSQFDGTGGAGSVHTTVEDFARWDGNWRSGLVGGGALAESLQVRGRLVNDSTISYALGVSVDSHRGLRVVSHTGSWAGYRGAYERFPEQHLSVATFCNLTTSGPDTLALKVAAVYLGASMGPDTTGAWEAALTSAPAILSPVADLRGQEGVWRNVALGEVRRTRVVGDSLVMGIGNRTRLVPLGGNRYRVGRTGTEVTFDGSRSPQQMRLRSRGGSTTWQRVDAVTRSAAELGEFAGDYLSTELETTWAIAVDSGKLMVRIAGRRVGGAMEPTYRDAFSNGGQYLDFERDPAGRITGFTLQAGRVRNLRFVRQQAVPVTATDGSQHAAGAPAPAPPRSPARP